MRLPIPLQILTFGLVTLIFVSVVTAVAATNTVPQTSLDIETIPSGLNSVKPSACAGIYLSNFVSGSGVLMGTEGNDLILGSPGLDEIDGLGGNDCILGGGGDDILIGNDGTDICVGGPGTDIFTTCEGESQ